MVLHKSHLLKKVSFLSNFSKIFLASSLLKNSKDLRFKILKIHGFRCFCDLTDDMTQLMLIFGRLFRVVSRAIYFQKTGRHPKSKAPK